MPNGLYFRMICITLDGEKMDRRLANMGQGLCLSFFYQALGRSLGKGLVKDPKV